MENIIKNKVKLSSLYYNQKGWGKKKWDNFNSEEAIKNDGEFLDTIDDNDFIFLKPLSSITDEDAVKVAKILHPNVKEWQKPYRERGNTWVDADDDSEYYLCFSEELFETQGNSFITYGEFLKVLSATDYLRSKGYALPFMNLSVEKQLEYGWIKLE